MISHPEGMARGDLARTGGLATKVPFVGFFFYPNLPLKAWDGT